MMRNRMLTTRSMIKRTSFNLIISLLGHNIIAERGTVNLRDLGSSDMFLMLYDRDRRVVHCNKEILDVSSRMRDFHGGVCPRMK